MAKIVQAGMPVAGFGVHNYWVLLDNAGTKVGEIHGVATKDGVAQSWVIYNGKLEVRTDVTFNTFDTDQKKTVAMGTMEEMANIFEAGKMAAGYMNAQNLSYAAIPIASSSYNSNSAFSTVGKAMNINPNEIIPFSGVEPGKGRISLSDTVINFIQNFFGIGNVETGPPLIPAWPDELITGDGDLLTQESGSSHLRVAEQRYHEEPISLIGVEEVMVLS